MTRKKTTKKAPARKTTKKKTTKKKTTKKKAASKRKAPTTILYRKPDDVPVITGAYARELLGWNEESDAVPFSDDYIREVSTLYKVAHVRMANNVKNRPWYPGTLRTLRQEILRGNWQWNGEPIIVGQQGQILNGQHTLVALVLACREWYDHREMWMATWPAEPTIQKSIVFGVEESDKVINTMDTCKPRSLGDVLYRSAYFAALKHKERKAAARICDYAIRCLWDRTGTSADAYAPRRTHAESLAFLDRHPRLLESVAHIQAEDGERGISSLLSPGLAAGLHYLMATCATPSAAYLANPREAVVDWKLRDRADEFWVLLASRSPKMRKVRGYVAARTEEGGAGRAEKTAIVIKAWTAFAAGKVVTGEAIALRLEPDEDGIPRLAEAPVIGGLDVGSGRDLDAAAHAAEPQLSPAEIEGRKADVRRQRETRGKRGHRKGKQWAKGDTAWVRDDAEGDHSFGILAGDPYTTVDGLIMVLVAEEDDGGTYEFRLDQLQIDRP